MKNLTAGPTNMLDIMSRYADEKGAFPDLDFYRPLFQLNIWTADREEAVVKRLSQKDR